MKEGGWGGEVLPGWRGLIAVLILVLAVLGGATPPVGAQVAGKPFGMPFTTPPGPNTWLLSQQYGNTVGAFNYGQYWYAGGQNLHFGLDFWAACGTPVVAVADGVIDQVDNLSFGLEPHNLTIFHRDLGLTSVYGHLNAKPTVMKGQPVRRGEVIAFSGDPDRTCVSRPHLHLEIRSRDYGVAYNPILLIDYDWSALGTLGYHGFGGFVKNLNAPRRWQSIFDQPDVDFNEAPLNAFALSWPPPARSAPPPLTRPAFTAPPIPPDGVATLRRLTAPGCCSQPAWSPDGSAVWYWDGPEGSPAAQFSLPISGDGEPTPVQVSTAPPSLYSADGAYSLRVSNNRTVIRRPDGSTQEIATGGAWPQFSPGGRYMLWHRHPADDIPGGIPPLTEIWLANADGTGRQLLGTQQGGSVYWLDDDRILLVEPVGRTNRSVLSILTLSTRQKARLAELTSLRGLSVAPGGAILLFYLPFQPDPAASGVYGMVTQPGAGPVKLPFFSSYRWRDSKTILYLLYGAEGRPELGAGPLSLALYDVTTGEQRRLTDPITMPFNIANDDWHVSPDGRHVVFWSADDSALWLISLP